MRRYAETFFRYWPIAMLPIVILAALGLVLARGTPKSLFVSANIWVDQGAASTVAGYNQWLSPAANAAATFNQLVQSPSFDLQVVRRSPLYVRLLAKVHAPGAFVTNDLVTNVQTSQKGDNLLNVGYKTQNAQLGQQVVNSLLTTARNAPVLLTQQQAKSSIPYYTFQLHGAEQRLAQSTKRLNDYLTAHSITPRELVTDMTIDPALASLYQQYQSDQSDMTTTEQQLSKLHMQSQIPAALAEQGAFRIIDPPGVVAVSKKKQEIMNMGLALGIGLLLSITFVVVRTLLNRTILYPDEVPALLDLPVLAVMPYRALPSARPHGTPPRRQRVPDLQQTS